MTTPTKPADAKADAKATDTTASKAATHSDQLAALHAVVDAQGRLIEHLCGLLPTAATDTLAAQHREALDAFRVARGEQPAPEAAAEGSD